MRTCVRASVWACVRAGGQAGRCAGGRAAHAGRGIVSGAFKMPDTSENDALALRHRQTELQVDDKASDDNHPTTIWEPPSNQYPHFPPACFAAAPNDEHLHRKRLLAHRKRLQKTLREASTHMRVHLRTYGLHVMHGRSSYSWRVSLSESSKIFRSVSSRLHTHSVLRQRWRQWPCSRL